MCLKHLGAVLALYFLLMIESNVHVYVPNHLSLMCSRGILSQTF